jgi:DNA-binding CsgD family transcriptional regulator
LTQAGDFVERLRHRDLQKLYRALSALTADWSPSSLSERTLNAVRSVVDCDFVTFDAFGGNGLYLDTRWNSDDNILTDELEREFGRLFNANPREHPLSHLLSGSPLRIEKFSDFVTIGEFKKTALYNEFFRRIDILHQVAFVIATDTGAQIACAINRRKPDFSERERTILELLAPRLATTIRGSIEVRKLFERQTSYDEALAKMSRAIVSLSADGKITHSSELGEQLIAKYFGSTGSGDSLPGVISDWVASVTEIRESRLAESPPFIFQIGNSQLRVEALNGKGSETLSLLLTERIDLPPAILQKFGLTNRESEILYWVAQGKNDDVIATLCSISVRTVNKHLERVYRKLGVESRLAAITLIRELLTNN